MIAIDVEKPVTNFVVPRAAPMAALPELEKSAPLAAALRPIESKPLDEPAEASVMAIPRLAPLVADEAAPILRALPMALPPTLPGLAPAPVSTPVVAAPTVKLAPLAIDTTVTEARTLQALPALKEAAIEPMARSELALPAVRAQALAPVQSATEPAAALDRRLRELPPVDLSTRTPMAASPAYPATDTPVNSATTKAAPVSTAAPGAATPDSPATAARPAPTGSAQGVAGGAPRLDALPPNPFNPPILSGDTKKPTLDLDAIRARARAVAGEGSGPRALIAFPTAPKEALKTKEQKIFDKALQRKECKDAYADMGLAAVVPLVVDTVKGDGCKW